MTAPTTIIVTGANRGIGQAICNSILSRRDSPSPLKLFATSRKGEDLGLQHDTQRQQVLYPKLDISSSESIRAFAQTVRQDGQGGVDVLVNNAGINLDNEYSLENARKTMDVNYRATLEMCQTFIPLLHPDGRIVNLSSVGSQLSHYSPQIQARFRNPEMTLDDLEQLAQEFEKSVQTSTESTAGFAAPGRSYSVSKACVNAFTRILSQQNPSLSINCCCPGWVATDMGQLIGKPPKKPEDGAKIPVRLALEDLGGVTGRYWANGSVRSRESGEVQEW